MKTVLAQPVQLSSSAFSAFYGICILAVNTPRESALQQAYDKEFILQFTRLWLEDDLLSIQLCADSSVFPEIPAAILEIAYSDPEFKAVRA
jgi:hypothetical protein